MVFEDVGRPNFVTDKFINHLEIIEGFIFALKRTYRKAVDFAVVVGRFSAVDTPSKLAAMNIVLIDLVDFAKLEVLDFLRLWIGNDGVVLDLVFFLY